MNSLLQINENLRYARGMAVGGVFRKKDNPVHAESALLEKKGNRRWRVERDMIRIVYFTPQKLEQILLLK